MLNWFGRRLQEVQDKKASGEAGFTLIELLVVVIIIGILAAIAIPTFLSQRNNAYEAQTKSDIRNAVTNAESTATSNNGSYSGVTAAKVQAGNADKNTTLTVEDVSATGYKINGVNKTNTDIKFCYAKATDAITTGACS